MIPKLLFFHNSASLVISDRLDEYFTDNGMEVDVFWAVAGKFPKSLAPYSAIYFSGSPPGPWEPLPWILREIDIIREAAIREIPMLGTCFGSQILAYALCGPETVSRKETYETDFVTLTGTSALATDPIGRGLPLNFPIFAWHRDEVIAEHPEIILLANSQQCGNHLWRHSSLPVWGMQGHPEVGGDYGREWFNHYVHTLKSDGLPASLVPASDREAVRTPEAMTLYKNFIDYVTVEMAHHNHGI